MKNKYDFEITISGNDWSKALDKAFKKKNKEVKIDGFRKGMAPKEVYIKNFGIESLYTEAIDLTIDDAFKTAITGKDLMPIVEPTYDIKEINEEKITYVFTIIVKPEVVLGEYKNLKVKKEKAKVTEEEIADEIKNLQNKLAEIVPKEKGTVEKGDTAVIDFEGFVDGKPLERGKGENFSLEIGSNTFIPGFEDAVIGMKAQEEKVINLKFPDDYLTELKGKDAEFHVKVNEIKQRIVPEVNEDFYLDLGYENIKTFEEFKEEVKKVLLDRKNAEIEDAFIEECMSKASENLKVQINEEIIDEEIHRMISQFEEQLSMQGIKMADYEKLTGMTHEKLHEQMQPEAIKRIKYRYLLEAIADKEQLDFTTEEVDAKAQEMADNYGVSVDELIKAYGSKEVVKYDMKMHKALEILKDNN